MKAKEYVEIYKKSLAETGDPMQAIGPVMVGLSHEYLELSNTRGKQTAAAAIACFDEINKKYIAFTYQLDEGATFNVHGFEIVIEALYPKLWVLLNRMRKELSDRESLVQIMKGK